ncbi:hypothetical protein SAMN06265361_101441 [Laceyella tengchongensis]|jgi:hypothetical protein|uniref:Uncharacterized protein n=1 Tax=Laceyella tengchongensis TaxID=574699 RepID=A0AA46ADA2_9BACL|nr:hypothetical protein [Laceyella tengchongensis]SMP03389.1 hypothetical protein SAMN06265361_101441 [Laceyella tengchongensis]
MNRWDARKDRYVSLRASLLMSDHLQYNKSKLQKGVMTMIVINSQKNTKGQDVENPFCC